MIYTSSTNLDRVQTRRGHKRIFIVAVAELFSQMLTSGGMPFRVGSAAKGNRDLNKSCMIPTQMEGTG